MLIDKKQFIQAVKCLRLVWLENKNKENLENFKILDPEWESFKDLISFESEEDEDELFEGNKTFIPEDLETADGIEVGKLARKYFELKYGDSNCHNYENDMRIVNLDNCKYKILFEPLFFTDKAKIRPDVLINLGNNKWKIIEVKSKTYPEEKFGWDLGYQIYILQSLNINIVEYEIMHINKTFTFDGIFDYDTNFQKLEKLFSFSDLLFKESKKYYETKTPICSISSFYDECRHIIEEMIERTFKEINFLEQTSNAHEPVNKRCKKFGDCKFRKYCLKNFQNIDQDDLKYSIYSYPGSVNKKVYELVEQNTFLIKDTTPEVLNKFAISAKKQAIKARKEGIEKDYIPLTEYNLIKNNETLYINKTEVSQLINNEWKFPLYMLDFEATSWAIPKVAHSRPYNHMPFQYSLHIVKNKDSSYLDESTLEHREFIYDFNNVEDIRLQISKSLIKDLYNVPGTILAYYKSYEVTTIKNLIKYCNIYHPDLSVKLTSIMNNIKDLWNVFSYGYYYDQNFLGRTSIKVVLPSLDKDFTYNNLKIQNGKSASDNFSSVYSSKIKNEFDPERWDFLKKNLLEYCKLDTLAMVVILNVLQKQLKKY